MKQTPPRDVDAYIAAAPLEARPMLEKLRKTIQAAVPKATEVISYSIPTYQYGKRMVCFGSAKSHCGLYGIGKAIMAALADELKPYVAGDSTIASR